MFIVAISLPLTLFYIYFTVPEFSLTPLNTVVPENISDVEVCIVLNGSLASNVVVTAETGPKSGASDQATGDVII